MLKRKSKVYIIGSISLFLSIYLLLQDWGVVNQLNLRQKKSVKKSKILKKIVPLRPTKEAISPSRINKIFSSENIMEIQKCISDFSSNDPEELSLLAIPKGDKLIFNRLNRHYRTPENIVLQHRSEGSPNKKENFFYKVENNLPVLITKNEFTQKSLGSNLIYKDEIKKSDTAEVITVENNIVKIDSETINSSLSCDLINQEWDCICIKN